MFSIANRHQVRKEQFDRLIELTPDEASELLKCEKTLASGKKKPRFLLARELLADFNHIKKIFKFFWQSPDFQAFCLQNEFRHLEMWSSILKILEYPGEVIKSVDDGVISIVDQYFGAFFYGEYLEFKRGTKKIFPAEARLCLDLACEAGVFKAFYARCEENILTIKGRLVRDADRTDALAQLRSDTHDLGHFYWSAGFLHAAQFLLDVGNFYANQNNRKTRGFADTYQKMAAECFLRARGIGEDGVRVQDNKLVQEICGDDVLQMFGFGSWDKAQAYFLKHVDNNVTPHDKLIAAAASDVHKWLHVNRYSSMWNANKR